MNDKIRDLMRSAIISVDCITGDESLDEEISKMYIPDCFAEKFAELIVRECIRVVQNDIIRNGSTPENERSYLHVFALRSHFGIKE